MAAWNLASGDRREPRAVERREAGDRLRNVGRGGTNLARETQEYMCDAWSESGEYAGVDRIGFVSTGTTAMAVKSQVEVPGAEAESFSDLETAVEWAQG